MPTRPAAVAGSFYPADPAGLSRQLHAMLADAARHPCPGVHPKALICPHAGYVYSGPTAARGYALLAGQAAAIRRVVLFGPTHRIPVRGLAVPTVDDFETPLGKVPIDRDARELALGIPGVVLDDASHAMEHSLEVQLPFLQTVLPDFSLLPAAVGDASPMLVGQLIERLFGGPETLFVISSDLSHFHPYAEAQRIDRESVEAILELDPSLDHQEACGATPVNGLLIAARRHGLAPRLIDLCNSGDTAGDKRRVVGYAALAFCEISGGCSADARLGSRH
jgi:MEMO1 family protein